MPRMCRGFSGSLLLHIGEGRQKVPENSQPVLLPAESQSTGQLHRLSVFHPVTAKLTFSVAVTVLQSLVTFYPK